MGIREVNLHLRLNKKSEFYSRAPMIAAINIPDSTFNSSHRPSIFVIFYLFFISF